VGVLSRVGALSTTQRLVAFRGAALPFSETSATSPRSSRGYGDGGSRANDSFAFRRWVMKFCPKRGYIAIYKGPLVQQGKIEARLKQEGATRRWWR
jgi:hypothetical protein